MYRKDYIKGNLLSIRISFGRIIDLMERTEERGGREGLLYGVLYSVQQTPAVKGGRVADE